MRKALLDFGLTDKESMILNCLIKNEEPLSGNEVAIKTGVTRYYAYEILHRLQERGFIEMLPGRPKRYSFDPSNLFEVIDLEEKNIEKNWKSRKRKLKDLATKIETLERFKENPIRENVVLWKGAQIRSRIENLLSRSSSAFLLRTILTSFQNDYFEIWEPLSNLAERNGKGRILLSVEKAENMIQSLSEDELTTITNFYDICPIRVSSTEMLGFDVIDNSIIIEFLSPTNPDVRLVIREPTAVQAKITLFDSLWERGQDFRLFAYAARENPTIAESLRNIPPHIPFPNLYEAGIHKFPSRSEAIRALQKILDESAEKEIAFANLEAISVDEELRSDITQILETLESSQIRGVYWRVLWKPHPEIAKEELEALFEVLNELPNIEVRSFDGPLDLGTFFLIDNSILLIPVFPLEEFENSILITRNPLIRDLVLRGFNQLWEIGTKKH